jgi:transcriptional regulator NrdR family protein
MNNNSVYDVASIKLNRRALIDAEAVPKSQVEEIVRDISSDIVKVRTQDVARTVISERIINDENEATEEKIYNASFVQKALDKKQNELRIDPRSSGYLELIDGYKIRVKMMGQLNHGLLTEHDESDIRDIIQQIEDHLYEMKRVDVEETERAKSAEKSLSYKISLVFTFVAIFAIWRLISILYVLFVENNV